MARTCSALASKVHKKSKKPRVVPTDEIAKAEEQADKIKEDGTKEAQAAIDREQQRIGAKNEKASNEIRDFEQQNSARKVILQSAAPAAASSAALWERTLGAEPALEGNLKQAIFKPSDGPGRPDGASGLPWYRRGRLILESTFDNMLFDRATSTKSLALGHNRGRSKSRQRSSGNVLSLKAGSDMFSKASSKDVPSVDLENPSDELLFAESLDQQVLAAVDDSVLQDLPCAQLLLQELDSHTEQIKSDVHALVAANGALEAKCSDKLKRTESLMMTTIKSCVFEIGALRQKQQAGAAEQPSGPDQAAESKAAYLGFAEDEDADEMLKSVNGCLTAWELLQQHRQSPEEKFEKAIARCEEKLLKTIDDAQAEFISWPEKPLHKVAAAVSKYKSNRLVETFHFFWTPLQSVQAGPVAIACCTKLHAIDGWLLTAAQAALSPLLQYRTRVIALQAAVCLDLKSIEQTVNNWAQFTPPAFEFGGYTSVPMPSIMEPMLAADVKGSTAACDEQSDPAVDAMIEILEQKVEEAVADMHQLEKYMPKTKMFEASPVSGLTGKIKDHLARVKKSVRAYAQTMSAVDAECGSIAADLEPARVRKAAERTRQLAIGQATLDSAVLPALTSGCASLKRGKLQKKRDQFVALSVKRHAQMLLSFSELQSTSVSLTRQFEIDWALKRVSKLNELRQLLPQFKNTQPVLHLEAARLLAVDAQQIHVGLDSVIQHKLSVVKSCIAVLSAKLQANVETVKSELFVEKLRAVYNLQCSRHVLAYFAKNNDFKQDQMERVFEKARAFDLWIRQNVGLRFPAVLQLACVLRENASHEIEVFEKDVQLACAAKSSHVKDGGVLDAMGALGGSLSGSMGMKKGLSMGGGFDALKDKMGSDKEEREKLVAQAEELLAAVLEEENDELQWEEYEAALMNQSCCLEEIRDCLEDPVSWYHDMQDGNNFVSLQVSAAYPRGVL
jgi:hypothetical protein